MHKNLGAQMLTRGLEVKDLKNWRKVIIYNADISMILMER